METKTFQLKDFNTHVSELTNLYIVNNDVNLELFSRQLNIEYSDLVSFLNNEKELYSSDLDNLCSKLKITHLVLLKSDNYNMLKFYIDTILNDLYETYRVQILKLHTQFIADEIYKRFNARYQLIEIKHSLKLDFGLLPKPQSRYKIPISIDLDTNSVIYKDYRLAHYIFYNE